MANGLDPRVYGFQGSNNALMGGAGAPVTGIGFVGQASSAGSTGAVVKTSGSRTQDWTPYFNNAQVGTGLYVQAQTSGVGGGDFPDIRLLVNDLRTAVMAQAMLERNARGGTRYTEIIRSHFGVVSPDARLQRPELLGHGSTLIAVNPVAQTSASGVAGTTTKLAELSAIDRAGSVVPRSVRVSRSTDTCLGLLPLGVI